MSQNNYLQFTGDRNEFKEILKTNQGIIYFKFTADWCGPCKKIKPLVDNYLLNMPSNVLSLEVNIDESIDLYAFLKKKKMVPGIPTLLAYSSENEDIYPDFLVSGSDENEVHSFFKESLSLLN